jgi:hypothetical protein
VDDGGTHSDEIDTGSSDVNGTSGGGNEHSSGGQRGWVVTINDEDGAGSTNEDTGGGDGSGEHSDEGLAEGSSESNSALGDIGNGDIGTSAGIVSEDDVGKGVVTSGVTGVGGDWSESVSGTSILLLVEESGGLDEPRSLVEEVPNSVALGGPFSASVGLDADDGVSSEVGGVVGVSGTDGSVHTSGANHLLDRGGVVVETTDNLGLVSIVVSGELSRSVVSEGLELIGGGTSELASISDGSEGGVGGGGVDQEESLGHQGTESVNAGTEGLVLGLDSTELDSDGILGVGFVTAGLEEGTSD